LDFLKDKKVINHNTSYKVVVKAFGYLYVSMLCLEYLAFRIDDAMPPLQTKAKIKKKKVA
tara:strand:+ start:354 stop:533 length:180 start_codon:yes stop_codon:yes gene_type:complete